MIRKKGRDIVDGIANRYGLDGSEFEPRWGEIFRTVQNDPTADPASYTMGIGSFPWANWLRSGVDHPPWSSADVKEKSRAIGLLSLWAFMALYRVKFYLYLGKKNVLYHNIKRI
jgi:hypothetical protein